MYNDPGKLIYHPISNPCQHDVSSERNLIALVIGKTGLHPISDIHMYQNHFHQHTVYGFIIEATAL